jgi:ATP-binding cassette, subfamily B, multidrug efflux pump
MNPAHQRELGPSLDSIVRPGVASCTVGLVLGSVYGIALGRTPREAGKLIDAALTGAAMNFVVLPLLVALVASAMIGLVVLGARYSTTSGCRVRAALFKSLEQGRSDKSVEYQTAACTNDVSIVQLLLSQSVTVGLPGIGLLAMTGVSALSADRLLAIPVLLTVPALLLTSFGIVQRASSRAPQAHQALDDFSAGLRDSLVGAHLLRTLAGRGPLGPVERQSGELRREAAAVGSISALLVPATITFAGVLSAALVWVGVQRISSGTSTPGQVAEFVGYIGLVSSAMASVASTWFVLPAALEARQRIEILLASAEAESARVGKPRLSKHLLEIQQASVDLEGQRILTDISLAVRPDSRLAVVGRSGSGKTSLLKLAAGSVSPSQGEVRFGDFAGQQRPGNPLARVLVESTSTLTQGTVRSCVALGRPTATDEEIQDALKSCEAIEFVEERGGLDARVHHGASNFSGGEQQRLALARALVALPSLLLLDEPFRSLDDGTGKRLWARWEESPVAKAIILASRRLPETATSTPVLLLEEGEVQLSASHSELLEASELYRALHGALPPSPSHSK